MFFGSLTLLEGKSVTDAKERISDAYVPTLLRNWSVTAFPIRSCAGVLTSAWCAGVCSSRPRSSTLRLCPHICASSPSVSSRFSGVSEDAGCTRPIADAAMPDAYLSSVNAKKQLEEAAEHKHLEKQID